MSRKLGDLVDINEIQEMLNHFYQATGFAIGIIETDGTVLVKSGWQRICEQYHRQNAQCRENCKISDKSIQQHLEGKNFYDYKCLNGLVDAAIPLIIEGEHIASLFFGQFFYEGDEGTEEYFRQQAKRHNFEEEDYLEAFREIPVYSREQVLKVMKFCNSFVKMLTDMGQKTLELRKHQQKLEELVKERTEELDSTTAILGEEEEKYHRIFNAVAEGIFIIDNSGQIVDVNAATSDIYGYSHEELLQMSVLSLVHPDSQVVYDAFKNQIGQNKNFHGETINIHKDGSHINTAVTGREVMLGGKPHLLAVVRDKTELHTAKRQVSNFFNNTIGLLCIIGMDGYFKKVNPAFSILLGYSEAEILAIPLDDFSHPDDVESSQKQFAKLSRGEKSINFINRFCCKDGSYRWLNWTSIPLEGSIFSSATDITESKLQEAKLIQERNFSAKAINSLPGIFYLLNEKAGFVRWNDNFSVVTGYSSEELGSINSQELFYHEDLEIVKKEIEIVFSEGTSKAEARILTKYGETIPYLLTGYRIEMNNKLYLVGTGIDISERKAAEKEIQETILELERSNNDLENFAYVASHDLQEPLRKISSFTGLLEQRYSEHFDEKGLKYMHYVTDGAERMQGLIKGLLQFSRISTRGKDFGSVKMDNVLEMVLDNLSLAIKENNVQIFYDKLPEVTGDDNQLMSLIQNLIGNAIKFHGKDNPVIQIKAKKKQNAWIFSVRDNGIGIDKAFSEKVFIIFQRLHSAKEYPGTGIGLSLCKKIVERHGGNIWFESDLNSGTTFYFTIPRIIPPKAGLREIVNASSK